MSRKAIIDIGSNSVSLIIVNIEENSSYTIIDEIKEPLRIFDGMNEKNEIIGSKIDATVATLITYKKLCDVLNTNKIIAVATEAIRRAINKDEIIKTIKERVGIKVRLLSGVEEAFYDYFAVVNSIDIKDGLIIDIGGASIELIWLKDSGILKSVSLPIGALTLANQFNLTDEVDPTNEKEMMNFLSDYFSSITWLKQVKSNVLIGIGGSIRNIAKIQKKLDNYPVAQIHNYEIDSTHVNSIYSMLKQKNLKQRKKIKGLSENRADIIIGITAVLSTLIKMCSVKKLIISGKGIREGLIYSNIHGEDTIVADVLDYSLFNLLMQKGSSMQHAMHVFKLTKCLHSKLKILFNNKPVDKILKTASILHDIGVSIAYYDHHKHSFYMILNSQINRLSQKELVISAYIALLHRNKPDKLNVSMHNTILDSKDIETIIKLGIILRLVESFDRGMTGIIEDIDVQIESTFIKMKTIHMGNAQLEINEARKATETFKEIFGYDLIIE